MENLPKSTLPEAAQGTPRVDEGRGCRLHDQERRTESITRSCIEQLLKRLDTHTP